MKILIFISMLAFATSAFANTATDTPVELKRHYVKCEPVDSEQARCLLWYYQDPAGGCHKQYILIKEGLSADALEPVDVSEARCNPEGAQFEQTLFNPSTNTCSDFYTKREGFTTTIIAIPTEENAC